MSYLRIAFALCLVALLGACSTLKRNEKVDCPVTSGACEITISRGFWPWQFVAQPSDVIIPSGVVVPVVWKFDAGLDYFFDSNLPNSKQDKVIFTAFQDGDASAFTNCWVTSATGAAATVGPRYRCFARKSAGKFDATYAIRFRGPDGIPRMVDPTIANSGSGFLPLTAEPVPQAPIQRPAVQKLASPGTTSVCATTLCKPRIIEAVDPKGAYSIDPQSLGLSPNAAVVVLVWSLPGEGFTFNVEASLPDGMSAADQARVQLDTCAVTTDANGALPPSGYEPTGKYFRCQMNPGITSLAPTLYQIQFSDAKGAQFVVQGMLGRP